MLFWRSFTHWVGGMGVLVFMLTILPMSGGYHMNLMRAESPGPSVERFVPTVKSTAKILYGIYICLSLLELLLLLVGKMPMFDALTLTFGTAGTGGFGIKNDSIGSYTTYQQTVITIFMILFGVNFNVYFLFLLKKIRQGLKNEELRDEFKCCNVYAKEKCQKCFAKFYCSGGCAANSYNFHGSINDAYDVGCELQRKRVECAIMIKAATAGQGE